MSWTLLAFDFNRSISWLNFKPNRFILVLSSTMTSTCWNHMPAKSSSSIMAMFWCFAMKWSLVMMMMSGNLRTIIGKHISRIGGIYDDDICHWCKNLDYSANNYHFLCLCDTLSIKQSKIVESSFVQKRRELRAFITASNRKL